MKMKYSIISIFIFSFFYTIVCSQTNSIKVTTFPQEIRTFYNTADGLPSNKVTSIVTTNDGLVYAGTESGLAVFSGEKWQNVKDLGNKPVYYLAANGDRVAALSPKGNKGDFRGGSIFILRAGQVVKKLQLPPGFEISGESGDLVFQDQLLLGTSGGIFEINFDQNSAKAQPKSLNLPLSQVRQIAVNNQNVIFAATDSALFSYNSQKKQWKPLYAKDGNRSWALSDCRGVVFDSNGQLWFASPQGAGFLEHGWTLFEGKNGLPYNDFSCIASGEKGVIWFGTHFGAIRFDGKTWEYRQGLRWLPDDDVRDISVTSGGDAWFATARGVGRIKRQAMTLKEKAKFYENEIDRYHRRTPYEYVLEVSLPAPGDKTSVKKHDSDNDGLWTSMYGAGECFAYAATKDPKAKARARKAFEALKFLGDVTRGSKHAPPPGFVARTILPTSGRDPNIGRLARDRKERETGDKLWKVIDPRWPKSKDGKWYWKCDTSSDELDGHYFFYALYYDLAAESESERERVRQQVRGLTDHLITHNYQLVDHDGKPTRWGHFSPEELNFDPDWFTNRGINSLSMLSYLAVAEHVTDDPKYRKAADELVNKHSYLQNSFEPKYYRGIGTGNQSDDEMTFMNFYNLVKYESDPDRQSDYALSFWQSWKIEQPEMNPFFNFAFAAVCRNLSGRDPFGSYSTAPTGDWLEDAVETLKRFPLDLVNWRHTNSRRIDLLYIHPANHQFDIEHFGGKGYRVNGKVIPVDECSFNHWNRDPWRLDSGGNGRELADGAVFLLPYYMGLYHGFIVE